MKKRKDHEFFICVHLRLSAVSIRSYQCGAARVFVLADLAREGAAGLLEAGEIPEIRKIAALLRFDRLHRAVFAVRKNALAVRFFHQRQAAPVVAQPRELLDELIYDHALERREPRDFRVGQTHLARPAAAGRATLTFQKYRHAAGYRNRRRRARQKLALACVLRFCYTPSSFFA